MIDHWQDIKTRLSKIQGLSVDLIGSGASKAIRGVQLHPDGISTALDHLVGEPIDDSTAVDIVVKRYLRLLRERRNHNDKVAREAARQATNPSDDEEAVAVRESVEFANAADEAMVAVIEAAEKG